MVGLDASGKTTILYKLKLGEIVTAIPTVGNYLKNSYLNEAYGSLMKLSLMALSHFIYCTGLNRDMKLVL